MNFSDEIPILVCHVLEAHIPEDASVVDEHINATEGLDSGLDDSLAVLNAVVIGHSLSTGSFDLVDDYISSLQARSARL